MNSTERYDRGRLDENDIEEVDNDENGKDIKDQNGKDIKDQNGREQIGVKVQEETSELNGKVKRVRVKEEVDKVKEEEDGVEKVEEEVDAALESRLSDRGKPWISTIYNTGKPFFSRIFHAHSLTVKL